MIFSDKDAIRVATTNSALLCDYLLPQCKSTAESMGADVFLLCSIHDDDIAIRATYGVDHEALSGAQRAVILDTLKDCCDKYPRPHVHNISSSPIAKCVAKLAGLRDSPVKAIYIPVLARDMRFVCLGISCRMDAAISADSTRQACSLCDRASLMLATDELSRKLQITEFFAKEVGHDIASSVQATVAKLRNITRGIITGKMAIEKTIEAEQEIMAAYRVAETLGITVDPNYNVGDGRDFNIVEAVRHVVMLYRSEADERHIEFKQVFAQDNLIVWGNRRAMESAIGQLVLNAIKYAKGSSYITVRVGNDAGDIKVSVTDCGIPLDPSESGKMWQYGERGKRALELHVNGSGIGLFTVKKIIQAHGGRVFAASGANDNIVIFGFTIPARDILKKKLGI